VTPYGEHVAPAFRHVAQRDATRLEWRHDSTSPTVLSVSEPQRYVLSHRGLGHVVSIDTSELVDEFAWSVDGVEVARCKGGDAKVTLLSERNGSVHVGMTIFSRPVSVTLHPDSPDSSETAAGFEFHPEPGSKAARREERILAHPVRYTLIQTIGAAARIAAGPLAIFLFARLVMSIPFPTFDGPDLPSIPWPDLPSIPWPDLPSFSGPDLPELPLWLSWFLEHTHYWLPVLIAFFVARGEIKRRRQVASRRPDH
jgi:hypothetical protein